MPEIFWHDRKALLSVDFHPVADNGAYRIVTSSVQKEVVYFTSLHVSCLVLCFLSFKFSFVSFHSFFHMFLSF